MRSIVITTVLTILILIYSVSLVQAQTTAFTYQGRLTNNSNAANGSYDFQFALFDALTGGNQVGTIAKTGVTVIGGETVIGAGTTIGANVFLMHSVPPNSLVISSLAGP